MKVIILAGSKSDSWHTDLIESALKELSIETKSYFKSAHKDPR
jgi:phosphoribosylcarboxyaminoimidazole (NCAIR) mutase